jgi:GT2 family glycosyltransferase
LQTEVVSWQLKSVVVQFSPPQTFLKGGLMAGSPVVQASSPESIGLSRIDFAQVTTKQVLVYGWILGFTKLVERASVNLGGVVIDLLKHGVPVRRPDVAQHFSLDASNDEHGFYALTDRSADSSAIDHLRLSVTLFSGETAESVWPVTFVDGRAAPAIKPYAETLKRLLAHLPRQEAKRLVEFARPALGPEAEAEYLSVLPPPVRFGVDSCFILENRILVVWGWLFDPLKDLSLVQLSVGESVFDVLENSAWVARSDLNLDASLFRKRNVAQLPGFIFVCAIPERDSGADEALFVFSAGDETAQLTHLICNIPHDARRDFLSLTSKLDPESALVLNERMATVLDKCPEQRSLSALLELICQSATERLPPSLQHGNPRYSLHLDQAIRVADKGVFLVGWFNAESPALVQVLCHCGSASYIVSDNWVRNRRADVSSHLAKEGITVGDHDHGYSCYVPLSHGDEPYYLSAVSGPGEVRRMRVPVTQKQESTIQVVRALLSSFNWGNRDLRFLMERHIGPAVEAIWADRQEPSRTPVVRSYGTRPVNPSVSVIVPLYGRYDFAEYQMALFADDADFKSAELIYVVDDPTIVNEFCTRCADLYGMYQVPFVVTYPSANLGFAGANNFAAEAARGQYLLFMNSDVLPKRTGWLGDLLRIYSSLPAPGFLGAKLLYEDGSVQHAGMSFRRLPAWGNLWTNHHPSKGLSPAGLSGVREVAAVTAACVLVDAALYRQLGGFSEDYIVGDFEDSDLCLRATLAGRRHYVALDVELYHLERQSQGRVGDAEWRTNITVYNCWLHNRRWDDLIERITTGQP